MTGLGSWSDQTKLATAASPDPRSHVAWEIGIKAVTAVCGCAGVTKQGVPTTWWSDGFSPTKNPKEMWSSRYFGKVNQPWT